MPESESKNQPASDKSVDLERTNASGSGGQWMQEVVCCLVCTLMVGLCVWVTDKPSPLDGKGVRAQDSYYNLLVQGFSEGHLYLKRDPPAALSQLANPYDPIANAPYLKTLNDLSYYKGKLYLYFGVPPALVLFWPYHLLTAHYLSDGGAVAILFAIGFAAMVGVARAICRRYFPETNIWLVTVSVLVLGLAIGLRVSGTVYEQTSLAMAGGVYEIAEICGFTFAMLALLGIWRAMNASARQTFWLLLASFAYGLAVGSRPTLLFGAAVLLAPAIQAWCARTASGPWSRVVVLFAAAVVPITLVGLGLMLYNDLRFGNPLEFGWHYQLNQNNQAAVHQFSLHYFGFDFWFYFLQPFGLSAHFPFLKSLTLPPLPSGHYARVTSACGAILTGYPLVLFALAVPLAWRGGATQAVSSLRWFVATLLFFFATVSFALCLYFTTFDRYGWDFLPVLLLLSVIGFLCVERVLLAFRPWATVLCFGWCLLLVYSLIFNVLLNIETRAKVESAEGNICFRNNRFDDAAAKYQRAEAMWPDYADAHYGLATTFVGLRRPDAAIAEFQKAVELEPKSAEFHSGLAFCLLQMGNTTEAVEQWKMALQLEPDSPVIQVNLAWVLATCPDASLRDGSTAVALAKRADQLTGGANPMVLRVLAAALAENGQYADAVAAAQQAIQLSGGNSGLAATIQEQMKCYENHQPFRDQTLGAGIKK